MFYWLVIIVICAVITAGVAGTKGRDPQPWVWYALLVGPIALIHVLTVKPNVQQQERDAIAAGELRRCPACAELVKREATLCRYCRTELPPPPPLTPAPDPAAVTAEPQKAGVLTVLTLTVISLSVCWWVISFFWTTITESQATSRALAAAVRDSANAALARDGKAEGCVSRGARYLRDTTHADAFPAAALDSAKAQCARQPGLY